ncbi:MAG: RNA polymerase sigma factor [Fimbriiglobus sp.]
MATTRTNWFSTLAHKLAPPASGSDAELLARYVGQRDTAAFAQMVERHAHVVRGVCRARLHNPADADDAFQVVFLCLARDAHTIRNREALAGWLVRVAHLTALKLRRQESRRTTEALPEALPDMTLNETPEDRETAAILTEVLAEMPAPLRAVLVLCGLEERSNSEAAEILGCPKGTVDSRLSTAKQQLRQKLLKRGVAFTCVVTLEALLARLGAAHEGLLPLLPITITTALNYGQGTLSPSLLTTLADGVTTTMKHTTRLIVAGLIATGVMTSAGFALRPSDPTPTDNQKPAAKAPPTADKKPPEAAKPAGKPGETAARIVTDETEIRNRLEGQCQQHFENVTLGAVVKCLEEVDGIRIRIDYGAYKRIYGMAAEGGNDIGHWFTAEDYKPMEFKINLANTCSLRLRNVLQEIVDRLPGENAYRIREGVIYIVPAHQPLGIPGKTADDGRIFVHQRRLSEQMHGDPISLSVESMPLNQVIQTLRTKTGANIILDPNALPEKTDAAKIMITATFDDVRLSTALSVIGQLAGDLEPVMMNNVFLLTSPEKAAKLQARINREIFGEDTSKFVPQVVPAAPANTSK